jgi:coenzyme F420-reducing hydrogenase delta subunit
LLKEMLAFVGVHPDRLLVDWVSASEGRKFQTLVTEFSERVRELGPCRERQVQIQTPQR